MHQLPDWYSHQERNFHQGRPVLTSFDGYFYLRQARDLQESSYTAEDPLRLAPQGAPRRIPPPLLSKLVSCLSTVMRIHVEWVAFIIPPLLSLTLALPVWLMARGLMTRPASLAAVLFALLAPGFVQRTVMGHIDTDSLVVTLTLFASLLPLQVLRCRGRRRILYALLIGLNAVLFYLWWDMAPHVVVAICLASVLPAFSYACIRQKEARPFLLLPMGAALLLLLAARGVDEWLTYPARLLGSLAYVLDAFDQEFLPLGPSVMEQARLPSADLHRLVSGHSLFFFLALYGLLLVFARRPRNFTLMLPVPLVLGALAFAAARFSIFLSPCLALGLAHCAELIFSPGASPPNAWARRLVAGLLVAGVGYMLVLDGLRAPLRPAVPGYWAAGAEAIREWSAPNTIVWTWWDEGHAVAYWSRRGVMCDGGHARDEIAAIAAAPLASSDFRQAANWIHFYAARGLSGINRVYSMAGGKAEGFALLQRILQAGPASFREILAEAQIDASTDGPEFFFPPLQERRPVLLLLDQQALMSSPWWFRVGTWHVLPREADLPRADFFDGVVGRGNHFHCPPHFRLDGDEGFLIRDGRSVPLSKLMVKDAEEFRVTDYRRDGPVFQLDVRLRQGMLLDAELAESVFNQLYFLSFTDERYFRPAIRKGLQFQYWEVTGDLPLD